MATMRELQPGVWHWQAQHPEWQEGQAWGPEVSSYAIDDGAHVLLFDPVTVPDEIAQLADSRELVVVLTAPWHERGTHDLVERFDVPVYVAEPDGPDVTWLLGNSAYESHLISAGQGLPPGEAIRWLPAGDREIEQRSPRCGGSLRCRALIPEPGTAIDPRPASPNRRRNG